MERDETLELPRRLISVRRFAELIDVSRSKGYEIAAANPDIVARIDGSIRIIVDRIQPWIERQAQAPAEPR